MSELDDLRNQNKATTLRFFGWSIVVLLAILLAWASQAELDEVATATGEVVPQSQIKTIQHLEGGIIEEMFVTEGDIVFAGSPLVQLDLSASGTREAELLVTLDGLMLRRARLLAEANGGEPEFPEDVAERRPQMAQNELNSLHARIAEMESSMIGLEEQVRQRESDLDQFEEEARALASQLALAREAFAMAEDLITDGLISRQDHLAAKTEVDQIRGQLATVNARNSRRRISAGAGQGAHERGRPGIPAQCPGRTGECRDFHRHHDRGNSQSHRHLRADPDHQPHRRGRQKHALLHYRCRRATRRSDHGYRSLRRSAGDRGSRLNPTGHVGYVREGQRATVKISTYDYIRYGGLDAVVTLVSPDSHQDESGNTYFRVVAETDRSYLGDQPGDFPDHVRHGSHGGYPHRDQFRADLPAEAGPEAAPRGLPRALEARSKRHHAVIPALSRDLVMVRFIDNVLAEIPDVATLLRDDNVG